jgi:hypothetical protein
MNQKSKPNQADMVVSFIHSLRMLSNGEAEVEEGSLLSDLWNLYRLHVCIYLFITCAIYKFDSHDI